MRYFYLVLRIIVLLLLSSCQTPLSEPPLRALQPEENLSAQEYLRRGIGYLEEGKQDKARQDFEKTIDVEPDSRTARTAKNLLSQIDAKPVRQLGRQYFMYKVQRGDSFSKIANKFLGDPLKFYILARYNDVEKPRYLEVGQVIKVPGEKPLPKIPPKDEPSPPEEPLPEEPLPEEPPPEEPLLEEPLPEEPPPEEPLPEEPPPSALTASDDAYQKAKELYNMDSYLDAIEILKSISSKQRSQNLLVESYIALADSLYANDNLLGAKDYLEQGRKIKPTNEKINRQLEIINKQITQRKAEQLYNQGLVERDQGNLEKAYNLFKESLRLQPDYSSAQKSMNDTKSLLINNYHQQAVTLYLDEKELCRAIEYWDKVLELDPNHISAANQQEKAKKILNNLNQKCP